MSVERQARERAGSLRASGLLYASLVASLRYRIERRESLRDSLVISDARRSQRVNGEALLRRAQEDGRTEDAAEIAEDYGLDTA